MDKNTDVLRSIIEALDQAPDNAKNFLCGYAEGLIAARPQQDTVTGRG